MIQGTEILDKPRVLERFKKATYVAVQYDSSIVQGMGFVNHLGSKEDAQEKFLAVKLVQNSY